MKFILANLMVLFITFKFVKTEISNNEVRVYQNHKKSIYIEILSDALNDQRWEQDEKPCLNTMMSILNNAKNFTLWAVWVLDTIQPPTGHLYGQKYHIGNYDECLKPHYGFRVDPFTPKTQYCVAEVALTESDKWSRPGDYVWLEHNVTADVYLKKPSKHGQVLSNLIWGICVPEVCQPSAVSKVARALLQVSHLGALSEYAGINVTHCENRDALFDNSVSAKFNIFVKVIVLLSAVATFCTYYVTTGKATPGTFVGELAHSFDLSRNMASLTKVRDDEVYSMNVLRIVTAIITIGIHYSAHISPHLIVNGLDQEIVHEEEEEMSTSVEILVETFLTLSGLLFVRGLFSDKLQKPMQYIWKRYVRLVPALLAIMIYMSTGHVGDGPLWNFKVGVETRICKENWLTNLLMISNMYVDKMCLLASWYVPCDFQLCVFVTILYIIYKKDKTLGKYAFFVAFVSAIVIPGVLTHINGLVPLLFFGVETISNIRESPHFILFYVKAYCRAGPFLVGAMMGYIMFTYKPKEYRKIIGKLSSYLALVLSFILMYKIMDFSNYLYREGEPLGFAIYAAIGRALWGLAICVIIGVSEYGNISLLNKAFSWYPLVPLSRLTYGVYLSHFPLWELLFWTKRTTIEFDMFSVKLATTGGTIYAYIASLVIWLLFEAPIININNWLLNYTWKSKTGSIQLEKNGKIL